MNAAQLFNLISCQKARYLHSRGATPLLQKRSEPFVPPNVLRAICAWFNAGFLHPLSNKKIAFDELTAHIDRIVLRKNGLELSKIIFASEPYSAAIKELALSVWILRKRFITINKIFVYYINKDYVKKGALDFDKLFIKRDVTRSVYSRYFRIEPPNKLIEKNAKAAKKVLCDYDLTCQYSRLCFPRLFEYSVLNVARLDKELKINLIKQGIADPQEIPENLLTDYQAIQIKCDKTKKAHIDKIALKDFLGAIEYPIYFLDFEAIGYAIPLFDQSKPFDILPFQFSLHILNSPNSRAKRYEFLADHETDGRSQIAQKLCDLIGEQGSVVAYGAAFEKSVIKGLAKLFADRRKKLLSIQSRIVDLMIPFERRWFYNAKMRGQCALKAVAPAINAKMTYDGAIKSGVEAMENYFAMYSANAEKREEIRRALLDYCRKDTLFLVGIYRKLLTLTKSKEET
ncbi:MAG: DUF2779 domain-containing protein [Helicobacteraceae bacterium]|nr:DUF2779 domain-containing protein [Helicobacteraceae bacterium]